MTWLEDITTLANKLEHSKKPIAKAAPSITKVMSGAERNLILISK